MSLMILSTVYFFLCVVLRTKGGQERSEETIIVYEWYFKIQYVNYEKWLEKPEQTFLVRQYETANTSLMKRNPDAEKEQHPIEPLPTCTHAMNECLRGKPCNQVFENFKNSCKAREGKCRMESRYYNPG
ncbi:hypothetical protein HZH68_007470 [Vespula germanica]|uniref:Uncharacterized protein n=1 Tax=Vespula germanica TaxID=30212 RepID=A0A834K861_VESGE|nr:hypothetical protein HZH68_007470 [Vespula germanica]